ncbi:glycosyl transferase [Lactiplantibacillus plantarum]|nr:glycosyl transferase [Lactiplantibacillus plantarum]MCG0882535.1 glycosyl transferase [Lactiplantibacillus plantarum]
MKHAILVEGSGNNSEVLQSTINLLDDSEIDFYIHWDAKFPLPQSLSAEYSKIYFVKPIKVYWGEDSQIKATRILLKKALSSKKKYDYIHLISSNDIPLMTCRYFKEYFTHQVYLGFDDSQNYSWRIRYYYPHWLTRFVAKTKNWWIISIWKNLQQILGISRNNDLNIYKGCNWWSVKSEIAKEILKYDISRFNNSFCGDELFVQTIIDHKFERGNMQFLSDSKQAARITFWDLPNQINRKEYFDLTDIRMLEKLINTNFAFLRKVKNSEVVEKLFKSYTDIEKKC